MDSGSGGGCADISEQVVLGAGPKGEGLFLPSAGPTQHDRRPALGPVLLIRPSWEPSLDLFVEGAVFQAPCQECQGS